MERCDSIEGNSLPLCFSSFKLLKENFKIINEAEKIELEQSHTNQDFEIINHQQYFHVFNDPTTYYMEDFINSKLQPLNKCEFEDKEDNDLVSRSTMSFFSASVPFQQSYADF